MTFRRILVTTMEVKQTLSTDTVQGILTYYAHNIQSYSSLLLLVFNSSMCITLLHFTWNIAECPIIIAINISKIVENNVHTVRMTFHEKELTIFCASFPVAGFLFTVAYKSTKKTFESELLWKFSSTFRLYKFQTENSESIVAVIFEFPASCSNFRIARNKYMYKKNFFKANNH